MRARPAGRRLIVMDLALAVVLIAAAAAVAVATMLLVRRRAPDGSYLNDGDRASGRRDRVHASEGVIPTPLWRVLFFIAGLIGTLDAPYRPGLGQLPCDAQGWPR
jgi:hypothetical protein